MKLSRRGKSARRGRHTKRAGKHLRYRGKKVRASKRYHRAHKRTYKRGRRVHRGGVLPQGVDDTELGPFALPWVSRAQELQELTTVDTVSGPFKETLHLYYTKTSDVGSRFSVEDKDFDVSVKSLNTDNTDSPVTYVLTMTRLGDAAGKTVSFTIELTVKYTVFHESHGNIKGRKLGDIVANPITYIDSKGDEQTFYVDPGGCKGLLNVKSDQGSTYDFRTGTGGGTTYTHNGPALMEIVDSIEKQIKNSLNKAASNTIREDRFVTSPLVSNPDVVGPIMPPRRK